MIKRQIPNLITLGNLLCGVMSCYYASLGHLPQAALLICLGIFLDFFDGLAARLLGVASPLGKELDSLADVVTSGVAPGIILFQLLCSCLCVSHIWLLAAALLVPAFAAYRLAKFNLDTRQSHSFLGLPVPANALIWVGIALAGLVANSLTLAIVLAVVAMITNILMVSEMPMFSLKFNFKDMSWKSNSTQYIFLAGCALIAVIEMLFFKPSWVVLSLIILWYILMSLLQKKHAE